MKATKNLFKPNRPSALPAILFSLVFVLFSVSVSAQRYAGDRSNYDNKTSAVFNTDETYIEECGSCHLAYAPGLLPIKSWRMLLGDLEDHFGENAEIDSDSLQHIEAYLQKNSLEHEKSVQLSKLIRNIAKEPPLRITELPQFLVEHESSVRQLGDVELPTGFFSPCEDCHKQASSGIFDKELIYKGYGPSFIIGDDPKLK